MRIMMMAMAGYFARKSKLHTSTFQNLAFNRGLGIFYTLPNL
jgi:hypothetical protein